MTSDGFVSAWRKLPLVGHTYEVRTFDGTVTVAKVVDARHTRTRVELTLEDGRIISTALSLEWRLAPR